MRSLAAPTVHPRVCGEHPALALYSRAVVGSSPRVWGTCGHPERYAGRYRFIPACVGNISPPAALCAPTPVHPRVCGEHPVPQVYGTFRFGSSPRVWGTYGESPPADRHGRFIPACVGNMPRRRRPRTSRPVHPRVCGEHFSASGTATTVSGSSPRVWGTFAGAQAEAELRRFIPACVGNMTVMPSSSARQPVHPRVCGEHLPLHHYPDFLYGSSPRVWGTCQRYSRASRCHRFIPACVGNIRPPPRAAPR